MDRMRTNFMKGKDNRKHSGDEDRKVRIDKLGYFDLLGQFGQTIRTG